MTQLLSDYGILRILNRSTLYEDEDQASNGTIYSIHFNFSASLSLLIHSSFSSSLSVQVSATFRRKSRLKERVEKLEEEKTFGRWERQRMRENDSKTAREGRTLSSLWKPSSQISIWNSKKLTIFHLQPEKFEENKNLESFQRTRHFEMKKHHVSVNHKTNFITAYIFQRNPSERKMI